MIDNEALGTIQRTGNNFEARLERYLEHDQARVWAMLTDPDRMIDWLAPGSIELKKGGAARLNFTDSGIVIDSIVTEFEENAILEYSWSGPGEPLRPVRWELSFMAGGSMENSSMENASMENASMEKSAAEDGTKLTLTLTCPTDDDVARNCAGWEAHLMMLLAAIEGVPIKFPFERFQSTRESYNAMLED